MHKKTHRILKKSGRPRAASLQIRVIRRVNSFRRRSPSFLIDEVSHMTCACKHVFLIKAKSPDTDTFTVRDGNKRRSSVLRFYRVHKVVTVWQPDKSNFSHLFKSKAGPSPSMRAITRLSLSRSAQWNRCGMWIHNSNIRWAFLIDQCTDAWTGIW